MAKYRLNYQDYNNVKIYKIKKQDRFFCDSCHPPINVPVKICGITHYYIRKWYNPFSWFKKRWLIEYEYIGD